MFVQGSPLRCWLLHLLHLGWTEALESDLGSCLLARGSREHEPEPLSPPLLTSLGHKQTQATETLPEPQAYVRGRFRHGWSVYTGVEGTHATVSGSLFKSWFLLS